MGCEPCLDIAATLRRQLVVDVSVQFVFGDGNLWVCHFLGLCVVFSVSSGLCVDLRLRQCRSLSILERKSVAVAPERGCGPQNPRDATSFVTSARIMLAVVLAIISPAAARHVRLRAKL